MICYEVVMKDISFFLTFRSITEACDYIDFLRSNGMEAYLVEPFGY